MEIFDTSVSVYDIKRALDMAGLPMQVTGESSDNSVEELLPRGKRLGQTEIGQGHDKFLRFIPVSARITAPRYWWQEFSTYHFAESNSQSTMHRITKIDIEKCCDKYTDHRIIAILKEYIDKYNEDNSEENFLRVKANIPEGLELTAGISTNYATLKTMYQQRKNHRLPEWREVFCNWVKSLPYVEELGVVR